MKTKFYKPIMMALMILFTCIQGTKAQTIDAIPLAPNPSPINCYPFGNSGSGWGTYMGFIYKNIPAFTLQPGQEIRFDLSAMNNADLKRNIYFGKTNDTTAPFSGIQWIQVVPNSQLPQNPRGNNIVGDFELTYTAVNAFDFNHSTFIIAFSGGTPTDTDCTQVLTATTSFDPSNKFVGRFWRESSLSNIPIDGTSSIGGFMIGGSASCPDVDGDGFNDEVCGGDDCDDNDASIYPGAPEVCDGIDNNCDGMIDEGFVDTDSDGQADCVDPDDDNDGILDGADNCPLTANAGQEDGDFDGEGDVCDSDFTACAFVDGMAAYINSLPNLPAAYKNVLNSRLNLAESRLCAGYNSQARNMLILFKNNVTSFKNIGFLTQAEADYLTAGANAFIAAIDAGTAQCGSCTSNFIAPTTGSTAFDELTVLPNPAYTSDVLNIRFAEMETASMITIKNTQGQLVWQADVEPFTNSIEVDLVSERFTNGVYFVTLHGEITQTQRVVISK